MQLIVVEIRPNQFGCVSGIHISTIQKLYFPQSPSYLQPFRYTREFGAKWASLYLSMTFHVQSQVVGPREASITMAAFEGFGARVFPVVPGQLITSCESPLAAIPGTLVRLLTCKEIIQGRRDKVGFRYKYIYRYLNGISDTEHSKKVGLFWQINRGIVVQSETGENFIHNIDFVLHVCLYTYKLLFFRQSHLSETIKASPSQSHATQEVTFFQSEAGRCHRTNQLQCNQWTRPSEKFNKRWSKKVVVLYKYLEAIPNSINFSIPTYSYVPYKKIISFDYLTQLTSLPNMYIFDFCGKILFK